MLLQEDLCLKTCYLYCAVDSSVSQHFREILNSPGRQEELKLGSPDSQTHAASQSMEVSIPGSLLLQTAKQEVWCVLSACFLTVCCDEVVLENTCTPAKIGESSGISFQMNLGILEFEWVLSV